MTPSFEPFTPFRIRPLCPDTALPNIAGMVFVGAQPILKPNVNKPLSTQTFLVSDDPF